MWHRLTLCSNIPNARNIMYQCITWHWSGLRFWVSCNDLFNPSIHILCVPRDMNTQRAVGTFWLLHVHQRSFYTAYEPNIRNFHRVTCFYARLTWTNKMLSQIFIHTVKRHQALQVKGKKGSPVWSNEDSEKRMERWASVLTLTIGKTRMADLSYLRAGRTLPQRKFLCNLVLSNAQ
jgi:hypothetical protein